MRFQTYLNEEVKDGELDLSKHTIFKMGGIRILDTNHGHKRIEQRNTLTDKELIKLFTMAIRKVRKHRVKQGERIVFWSKSLKQAFIAKIKENYNLVLVTFYPRGEKPDPQTHPWQHEVDLT